MLRVLVSQVSMLFFFFFSSRRRHTRSLCDWSSDVCSSDLEQALKRSQEAVALAEGLSHPFSLAYALGTAARFHLLRREEQVARERAEAAITLSTEQGFRSEERRVGKECRARWEWYHEDKKE